MKVSELSGTLLDYWVARATGAPAEQLRIWPTRGTIKEYVVQRWPNIERGKTWSASTEWHQAGPIIDENAIGFNPLSDAEWIAEEYITGNQGRGPTPLIASMRAFVRSKFGETVPDSINTVR